MLLKEKLEIKGPRGGEKAGRPNLAWGKRKFSRKSVE